VDAPYEREFAVWQGPPPHAQSNAGSFPDFELYGERARLIFEELTEGAAQGDGVRLVVEAGVAACDDGGEPLLGSYLPPGGEPGAPVGAAEITVYYRTFRAIWDEDGLYDWEEELRETIGHELEHHAGWRVGYDSMDDDERSEIVRERVRLVGRSASAHESLATFGADVRGFVARTWPIWLIVVAVSLAMIVCGR
jgi:hypothetical protein